MKEKHIIAFLCLFFFSTTNVHAYWVWSPEEGKFVNSEGEAQDAAEEQFNYAKQFYKEKNIDEATKQFEDLLRKYPTGRSAPEAQYMLGVIYEEKGDYIKAFNNYKDLIDKYPQSERVDEVVEREFRIGNLFLSGKKGKFMGVEILPSMPTAIEIFQHIVTNAPYSEYGDKAQFRLGVAYRKAGKFADSIDAFQSLIEQYPQSELVTEARFQMAETSFSRSAFQFRDQRALEDAAQRVDQFLVRHPDDALSEQAAKIRQQIDEKNAEKNYEIGVYYEKTNYLKSSLIYYSDVARRYPHTKWGQKAADKLKALESPAEFHQQEASSVASEIESVKGQLEAMPKDEGFERKHLKRKLDLLEEKQKQLEKETGETLKSRREDIKRREGELKEKFKKLEQKKELLKDNPSQDLKNALDRWETSLLAEQATLADEKHELEGWHHDLGKKLPSNPLSILPFVGDAPEGVQDVRQLDAKKFYKIASHKKDLLSKKELLYKHHGEVVGQLNEMQGQRQGIEAVDARFQDQSQMSDASMSVEQEHLSKIQQDIAGLERDLQSKRALYDEHFGGGFSKVFTTPAKAIGRASAYAVKPIAVSISAINPFDNNVSPEKMSLNQLLEKQMHLKEKEVAQASLVNTLGEAFNEELALKERQRLLRVMQDKKDVNPADLRKQIRAKEKSIRGNYEEIKDRHKYKKELVKELDAYEEGSKGVVGKTASVLGGPFRLSRDFLFGHKSKAVELTEKAETARELEIKQLLEEESLLIEARYREIENLEKELEILKAQASLKGGFKFRSAFVDIPYRFVKEAVEGAGELLPKRNKEEALINLLDKESRELEEIRKELRETNDWIDKKTMTAGTSQAMSKKKKTVASDVTAIPIPEEVQRIERETAAAKMREAQGTPDQKALQEEIGMMQSRVEQMKHQYASKMRFVEKEQQLVDNELGRKDYEKWLKSENKSLSKLEEKLIDELEDIEKGLKEVIHREQDLEKEELEILNERIEKIDKIMKKTPSTAVRQDLLNERGKIEERIKQIELRQDFLKKEQERFEMASSVLKT